MTGELHYKIGLIEEAQKYAYLLGYNYQSSQWYEASFNILNKQKEDKKIKTPSDEKNILSRFKKMFK